MFFWGSKAAKEAPKVEKPASNLLPSTDLATINQGQLKYPYPENVEEDVNLVKEGETNSIQGDDLNFKILGHETHVVQVDLMPRQFVRAETGNLLYMTEGVTMETNLQTGIGGAFKRMIAGGSLMLTDFKFDQERGIGRVVFSSDFPAKIIPIRLNRYQDNSIICSKGSFICSSQSVELDISSVQSLGAGFFGGEGFILQKLTGNGTALLKAGGAVIRKKLRPDETLRVSSGSLVCFESSVQFQIQRVGGIKNILFGGEGLFLTTLTGPGEIILQGMPFDRLVGAIASRIPTGGGGIIYAPGMGGSGGGGGPTPGTEAGGSSPLKSGESSSKAGDTLTGEVEAGGDGNEGGGEGGGEGDGDGGWFQSVTDIFKNEE